MTEREQQQHLRTALSTLRASERRSKAFECCRFFLWAP